MEAIYKNRIAFEFEHDHDDYSSPYLELPQYTEQSQDGFLRAVIRFLFSGEETEEALLLLTSQFEIVKVYREHPMLPGFPFFNHWIFIACQEKEWSKLVPLTDLDSEQNQYTVNIHSAFKTLLGKGHEIRYDLSISNLEECQLLTGWREEYYKQYTRGALTFANQGRLAGHSDRFHTWNNMRFASEHEVAIAQALEKRAVIYLPLCYARLGRKHERQGREIDFLICYKGNWGILEVDGVQHSARIAGDKTRDKLFKYHGVKVIERYRASFCLQSPTRVVTDFLKKLTNAS